MEIRKQNQTVRFLLAFFCSLLIVLIPFLLFSTDLFAAGTDENAAKKLKWHQEFGNWVGGLLLSIAASFAWLGGMILDRTIIDLVLQMGNLVGSGEPLGRAIEDSWKIIRDFANLIFIFGFVYIGIRTIFDYESANTKRMLVSLVIAALLINFSLFITRVVIDAANLLTAEMHFQVTGGGDGEIGLAFAEQLGIVSLYETPDPQRFADMTTGGNISFFIMGALFLFIAGFVFAAGGILLMIRFAALVLIMIFSPLLFAATVFPQTNKYAIDLWQKLFSYAFFAPVYLLLIYITYYLVSASGKVTGGIGGDGFSDALTTGAADAFAVILQFLIIIMFLIFALMAAQKMSIKGGEQAVKFGKNLRDRGRRTLGSATIGGAAALGRSTVGYAAHRFADSKGMRSFAAKSKVGEGLLKGTRGVADSSFDARKIGGAGKALGIGEGKKGGYTTHVKEAEQSAEKFAKSLGKDEVAAGAAREERSKNVLEAQQNLEAKKDEMRTATKDQREALREEARKMRDQNLSGEEREAATSKVAALRAEINTIEEGFKPLIDNLEEAIKSARTTGDRAVTQAENTRQRTYGERRQEQWGYKNKQAGNTVIKMISKSKEDKEKEDLLDAIKNIKVESNNA